MKANEIKSVTFHKKRERARRRINKDEVVDATSRHVNENGCELTRLGYPYNMLFNNEVRGISRIS